MLYKRSKKAGSHWWVRFSVDGREIRCSSGTNRKELAQEFEQELRNRVWRERQLGQEIHTWSEAVERWLTEKAHKRALNRDRQAFAAVVAVDADIESLPLLDIDAERLRKISAHLNTSLKQSTVNRTMAVVRALLRRTVVWEWLMQAPHIELGYVERLEPRWLTEDEFDRLAIELPPHARALAKFAVYTGLRQANIYNLKWESVDLVRRTLQIKAAEYKSNRSVGFPLNTRARWVLRGQRHKHPVFVFTDHEGNAPIGSIKTTWLKAVKRAGLEDVRFHDLRHTWAAWHALAGRSPIQLMQLGGWSSLKMIERYAHINPVDLAHVADNRRHSKSSKTDKQRGLN